MYCFFFFFFFQAEDGIRDLTVTGVQTCALPISILCLLPGSRNREIEALWPVFMETFHRIHDFAPDIQVIVPTLPHLIEKFGVPHEKIVFVTERDDKYAAMQASTVALHASGTVALELALCGTPMVTAYKVSPF